MRYRQRVLVLLFFLSIVTYMDRVAIGLASKGIHNDLNITDSQWWLVLGAFASPYAAVEIPGGSMGDRIGRRRVLSRIVIWWSAFTAITGVVKSYPALLISRFMFGAGEAGAYP